MRGGDVSWQLGRKLRLGILSNRSRTDPNFALRRTNRSSQADTRQASLRTSANRCKTMHGSSTKMQKKAENCRTHACASDLQANERWIDRLRPQSGRSKSSLKERGSHRGRARTAGLPTVGAAAASLKRRRGRYGKTRKSSSSSRTSNPALSSPPVFRCDREDLVGDPGKGSDDIRGTAGNRLFRHAEHDRGGFMFGYGHRSRLVHFQ
jgi:hypothetical protein